MAYHGSLSATSTCLTYFDLLYTGQAYFSAEKHSASPVVRILRMVVLSIGYLEVSSVDFFRFVFLFSF